MMDLEQAAQQCGVVPPEKVASLLASLKKVPDYSWVILPPHPSEERLQGDVLSEFPVAVVDDTGNPRCKKLAVLVLNNTCDLQQDRSQFVTVAPTMDFARFSQTYIAQEGEDRARGYLRAVRANQIYEILWLPSFASFKDGAVVFLNRVGSASGKLYEDALKEHRRLASFSQNGFYFLLIKLTNHIARMETGEITRLEAS
jgi:hypothetical protein